MKSEITVREDLNRNRSSEKTEIASLWSEKTLIAERTIWKKLEEP